jgi:hypothetical protein
MTKRKKRTGEWFPAVGKEGGVATKEEHGELLR